MIKENTKKTLVWCYPTSQDWRWVNQTRIKLVVPQLTPAGVRSLLYGLERKQLILTRRQAGEIQYGLTTMGKTLIEAEIPALAASDSTQIDQSSVLIFLESPASDRNFRYLRQFLLNQHWVSISRGVFLYPNRPSEVVLTTVQRLYAQSVVILRVSNWLWGDERLLIGQQSALNLADELYSGISREVKRLIEDLLDQKELDDQAKIKINSVFDRLYSALSQDFTLVSPVQPNQFSGRTLLAQLQLLG
jgi:DNA-binding transcriptional regulator PaaX